MNKITISTGHPDAGRVYAEAYEESLAREAALREELKSLSAVRNQNRVLVETVKEVEFITASLKQSLTVAEQRSGKLEAALLEEMARSNESAQKCIESADRQHLRAVNAERERDAALAREAALDDHVDAALRQVKANWDYAQDKQQRLTVAEQRAEMLEREFKKLRDVAYGCYQIASSYSGCIDGVEEHGGDDHEDPSCAIYHRLYYAMFDADAALKPTAEVEGS